jgi:hypothetical protein
MEEFRSLCPFLSNALEGGFPVCSVDGKHPAIPPGIIGQDNAASEALQGV